MTRIGVPAGRLRDHVPGDIQIGWPYLAPGGRQLRHVRGDRDFFVLRAKAIPSLVAHGMLDVGYCGSDSIGEFLMPELLDVEVVGPQEGVGMVAAAARGDILKAPLNRPLVVGTSYPVAASRYLSSLGKAHIVVEQPGCIEGLCPALVDLVVDVTESGETLRINGLSVIEELGALTVVRIRKKP